MGGRQKLLRQLRGPVDQVFATVQPAVISTVTAGAASDGNALVTVSYRGLTYEASYSATYTPVVGHNVLLLVQGDMITILHRVIGTP